MALMRQMKHLCVLQRVRLRCRCVRALASGMLMAPIALVLPEVDKDLGTIRCNLPGLLDWHALGLLPNRAETQGAAMKGDRVQAELPDEGSDEMQPQLYASCRPLHRDAGTNGARAEGELNDPSEHPTKLIQNQKDLLPGLPCCPGTS